MRLLLYHFITKWRMIYTTLTTSLLHWYATNWRRVYAGRIIGGAASNDTVLLSLWHGAASNGTVLLSLWHGAASNGTVLFLVFIMCMKWKVLVYTYIFGRRWKLYRQSFKMVAIIANFWEKCCNLSWTLRIRVMGR